MSKYLTTTTEIYRVDSESEVQTLIEEAKHASAYTLVKYNREYKERKSKGATITAKFRNGSEGVFSADMFDELKQDGGTVYIIDSETGEALYIA